MLVVVPKDVVVVILRRQLVKMPLISASMDLLRASGVQETAVNCLSRGRDVVAT